MATDNYADKIHVTNNFVNTLDTYWGKAPNPYDIGIIELRDSVESKTGKFGLSYNTNADISTLVGTEVTLAGYPYFANEDILQYTEKGPIRGYQATYNAGDKANYFVATYAIDATSGQSGAPVYAAGYVARAIHASESAANKSNYGTVINKVYFDWINGYINN